MGNVMNAFKNALGDNKQKLFLLTCILGVIIAIIVTISIVVKIIGVRISYEELEEKLATATERYMNDNPGSLPTESNPTVVVSTSTLIEGKYIKQLQKYVKDSSCTANINVLFNNGKYKYQPFLTCNSFKTEIFKDKIKAEKNISQTGEGLYEMNGEFVYRGQEPNNYLKFADQLWRIIKINAQGQIILIQAKMDEENYGYWDDRYNIEIDSEYGNNNFSLSRALTNIQKIYNKKISKYQESLSPFSICNGLRSENDMNNTGAIECKNTLDNQWIGLLPLYDYINASLDRLCYNANSRSCQNYNYLVDYDENWWTVTGNTKNTYSVYRINYSGEIESVEAADNASYRYIIALNSDILYKSGAGTENDPYIIR